MPVTITLSDESLDLIRDAINAILRRDDPDLAARLCKQATESVQVDIILTDDKLAGDDAARLPDTRRWSSDYCAHGQYDPEHICQAHGHHNDHVSRPLTADTFVDTDGRAYPDNGTDRDRNVLG